MGGLQLITVLSIVTQYATSIGWHSYALDSVGIINS